MAKTLELIGCTFGRLIVLDYAEPRYGKGGQKVARWKCLCNCGNTEEILVDSASLRSGNTKSCGCIKRERITKHGLSKHPLYKVWHNMKERCYNPQSINYGGYGGKGITVCSRWLTSFENFYEDVLEGYSNGLELDRKENDGNYTIDNVRWVTTQQNQMNKGSWKNSTSKYKGVCWDKKTKKWRASIQKDREVIYLGQFIDEKDAAIVYNKAALELFGEYANLNIIGEREAVK